MFCKQCGMRIEDNWIVCPNCGTKLSSYNIEEEFAKGENNTEKLNLGNNEMRVKTQDFQK